VFLKWTYFHLSFYHEGFPITFPMVPVNSIRIHTWEIHTIEIGVGTTSVPPSTSAFYRAVLVTPFVIISVFGRKHHPVVITE
jgi:hypothetical protein